MALEYHGFNETRTHLFLLPQCIFICVLHCLHPCSLAVFFSFFAGTSLPLVDQLHGANHWQNDVTHVNKAKTSPQHS